jgi:ATP-binding protein involved in chromosome partitioning
MSVTKELVLKKLSSVLTDESKDSSNIVEAGLVSEIVIANDRVFFAISTNKEDVDKFEIVRKKAEEVVKSISGVSVVRVSLTSHDKRPVDLNRNNQAKKVNNKQSVDGIKHIIAVASGKGGVGKSTTAVNLALSFRNLGLSVGILDADIYGPSVPKLLGIKGRPNPGAGKKIQPLTAYSITAMSMGFLVDEETPMIWRGPMVISAITQMLREVDWGDIDLLVVDMPPGTGDVQLTMAQNVPIIGSVIVSTPQDLALIDARKGISMFQKVNIPVLGIIENMSTFVCPKCGEVSHIFGKEGAMKEAKKSGVPYLGDIPLEMDIRIGSDLGKPIVEFNPGSVCSQSYNRIANDIWLKINSSEKLQIVPNIVYEE